MPYSIELGPESSPDATLDASDIVNIDVAKPHTALADFDAEIPYSRSIDDHVLKRLRIYANDTVLFRGYLKELDWNQKRGRVRLNGPGIGDDLRDSAIERSFQNVATHEAIRQVWDQDTAFNYTVREPNVTVIAQDRVVVDASTQSELRAIIDQAGPTAPVYVDSNGNLRLAQSLHFGKDTFGTGERGDSNAQGEVYDSNGNVKVGYLGGDFGESGDTLDFNFTLDYDIPSGNVGWAFRYRAYDNDGDGGWDDLPQMETRIDGTSTDGFADRWGTYTNDWHWFQDEGNENDIGGLSAGDHTFSIVQTKASDSTYDEFWCDMLVVYDTRFSYNWDNTVSNSGDGTTGTYNYLDGPELYPDGYTLRFDQVETDFNVVGITLSTSGWNDTTGAQKVGISFDGGSTWFDNANATSIDKDQTSNVGATVDYRATFDRFGSGQQRTPDQGYKGQYLGSVTVDYDGSDLSIIQDNTYRGSPLKILKDLHQKAGYRFVIDHAATDANGNLQKTVESFETGSRTKSKDWTVVNRSPRRSFTDYANEVTVYGALASDGTRPKATVQDDQEVNQFGREPYFEILPDLTTVDQVRNAAIDILTQKVQARTQKGTITALPTTTLPGYSYPVDWFADGNRVETPNERVQFRESANHLRATLKFVQEDDVTGTVISQGREIDRTRKGV